LAAQGAACARVSRRGQALAAAPAAGACRVDRRLYIRSGKPALHGNMAIWRDGMV
jgi:hypothetical protein